MLTRWAVIVVILAAGIYLSLKANVEYYSLFHGKNSEAIRKEFIDTGKYKQFDITTSDLEYYINYRDIKPPKIAPQSIIDKAALDSKENFISKNAVIDSLHIRFTREHIDYLRQNSIALGIDLQGGLRIDAEFDLVDFFIIQNPNYEDKKEELKNIRSSSTSKNFIDNVFEHYNIDKTEKEKFKQELDKKLISSASIIRNRLDESLSIDAKIKTSPPNRISVTIAGITADKNRVLEIIKNKGALEFIIVKDKTADWNRIITKINRYNDEFSELITPYFDINSEITPYVYIPNSQINQINAIINGDKVQKFFKKTQFLWGIKNKDIKGSTALYYLSKDVKLSGADIKNPMAKKGDLSSVEVNKWRIDLEFKDAKDFKKITERYKGKLLAIVLDDVVQISPRLSTVIDNGRAYIDGNFKKEEAKDIATILESGELAARVNIVSEKTVPPSMAKEDQDTALLALGISFTLVLLFMVFYYKIFGLIANIAMLLNIPIILGIISTSAFKDYDVTELSLFGIFGFVLTIGMAIDANVIIFERIKEEFSRNNKAFDAIEIGYKKAFRTILDSNLTTLLAAMALAIFGGELTRNFGYMLILGLGSSMFTSIFVTKTIAMTYFKIKPFKRLSI